LNSKSYQELKIRVKKAIPYPFATLEWYFKASLIFGLAVFLEFESLLNGPSVLKALVLGVIMAMIGLCIQHDANHGAVSPNGWVNRIWGYTQVSVEECSVFAPCIKCDINLNLRTGSEAALCFGSITMYFCTTHTQMLMEMTPISPETSFVSMLSPSGTATTSGR
jgi:hypothetical protein